MQAGDSDSYGLIKIVNVEKENGVDGAKDGTPINKIDTKVTREFTKDCGWFPNGFDIMPGADQSDKEAHADLQFKKGKSGKISKERATS